MFILFIVVYRACCPENYLDDIPTVMTEKKSERRDWPKMGFSFLLDFHTIILYIQML